MSANGEVEAPETKRGLVNSEEVFHSSLTAGGLHVLLDLVDDLVQVGVSLTQGVAFRSDVAVMEAEVLGAEPW